MHLNNVFVSSQHKNNGVTIAAQKKTTAAQMKSHNSTGSELRQAY